LIFVSYNLTEGWYEQYVYYEEDDALLQTGPFYSYGDSTEFEVVNVDNLVSDENDDAVYDDVGFLAHQGNTSEENGVEGVGIEISKYNHSTEEWDYHAYVETNETGEAWLYNEACGEYEWYASDNNEKGYYEVWAGCDDTGGGNGTEDDDEWFYDWGYDVDPSETITIGYDPDTECDCNVTIYVDIDVYTENGTHIDTVRQSTIFTMDMVTGSLRTGLPPKMESMTSTSTCMMRTGMRKTISLSRTSIYHMTTMNGSMHGFTMYLRMKMAITTGTRL
jgi:hypothetical protein